MPAGLTRDKTEDEKTYGFASPSAAKTQRKPKITSRSGLLLFGIIDGFRAGWQRLVNTSSSP
jgi:hypothetical protein